nr:MAG TPA: hypothetical protein [Caudoviricetes sp.]
MYFISFIWLIFFSPVFYSTIFFFYILLAKCSTIIYNFCYCYLRTFTPNQLITLFFKSVYTS